MMGGYSDNRPSRSDQLTALSFNRAVFVCQLSSGHHFLIEFITCFDLLTEVPCISQSELRVLYLSGDIAQFSSPVRFMLYECKH